MFSQYTNFLAQLRRYRHRYAKKSSFINIFRFLFGKTSETIYICTPI